VVLPPLSVDNILAVLSNATVFQDLLNDELQELNATSLTVQVTQGATIITIEGDEVRVSVDLIQEVDLDVRMYSGVVLEGDNGFPASLTPLSTGVGTTLPNPKPTLLDGVITVAASYKNATPNADPTDDVVDGTVLTADLFRLTAVYLSDPQPGGDISSRIAMPVASYSPATGELTFDTSGVCLGAAEGECEVKTLVQAAALQGDADSDGSTPETLAVHVADDVSAGQWMQSVAGTNNGWIESQGRHFHSQMESSFNDQRRHEAYWINPRKETRGAPTQVGSRLSTAVVVFAVWSVRAEGSARRAQPHRALLQTLTLNRNAGRQGDRAVQTAAVSFDVSPVSQLALAWGVPDQLVSRWIIQMGITAAEACEPRAAVYSADAADSGLVGTARSRLLQALSSPGIASHVLDVQVTSMRVERGGVDCARVSAGSVRADSTSKSTSTPAQQQRPSHGRALAAAPTDPSMLFEALVVFADPADGTAPWLDVDHLKASAHGVQAALLSDRITSAVDVIETARDDKTDSDGDKAPAGADTSGSNAPETDSDRDLTIAIACASGAVVLVAIVAIGVVLRLRWKRGTPAGGAVLDSVRAVSLANCGKRDGTVGEIERVWTEDGAPVTWHKVVSVPGSSAGSFGRGSARELVDRLVPSHGDTESEPGTAVSACITGTPAELRSSDTQ